MTSSRRSWQKSMSKSGIDTRSGLRKRSKIRPKLDRIDAGDQQRPRHQGPGARAAPRPDRNVVGHRPFHEVGHDEEIAGEAHGLDDADLALQAGPVDVLAVFRRGAAASRARRPARAWAASSSASGASGLSGEAGQDRDRASLTMKAQRRAISSGVIAGLGQVGEQAAHVRRPDLNQCSGVTRRRSS